MSTATANRPESRLVLRAQSGDRSALDDLLRMTQPWLIRFLTGLVRERHDAEDILQDVSIQIYRKLKYLDEPRAYRAWVYRIAWRLAHRALKRAYRFRGVSFDQSALDENLDAPSPDTLDSELVDRIHAQIEQLPPNTRAVLVLHYSEELTIREVADVLGVPDGTIKSRLAYGLALLRERVRKE